MGRTQDRQNRHRVLLVEDDPIVLESTAAVLSDDADVVTVGSAEGALRALAGERFDVVCTDYKMPGMNGVELLRRVSELPYSVGCLLITGNDEYLRSESGSPYYVLVKPYEPEKLIRLVEQLARIARMRRTAVTPGASAETGSVPPPSAARPAPMFSAPGRISSVPPVSSLRSTKADLEASNDPSTSGGVDSDEATSSGMAQRAARANAPRR